MTPESFVGNRKSEIGTKFSLALMWRSFQHQVSLRVENLPKLTWDTPVVSLGSNPGTGIVWSPKSMNDID